MATQTSTPRAPLSPFGRAKRFVLACVDVLHDVRAMQAEAARRARYGNSPRVFQPTASGAFRR
jgi:hypothetical protein